MLVLVEMQIALGLLIFFAKHAVGRGELGHDEAASAEVADEATEDRGGAAAQGREDGRRRDSDVADGEAGGHGLRWPCLADEGARATRVVPELLHRLLLPATTRES